MKYIVFAIGLAIMASCAPFGLNPEGYEILSEPLEIAWPKSAALEYIETDGFHWKSPHETLMDGGGECRDIVAVLMYFLGPDSSMVSIRDGDSNHAIVKYHGLYLEAQCVNIYYDPALIDILDENSWNYVMSTCTHYGTASVQFTN